MGCCASQGKTAVKTTAVHPSKIQKTRVPCTQSKGDEKHSQPVDGRIVHDETDRGVPGIHQPDVQGIHEPGVQGINQPIDGQILHSIQGSVSPVRPMSVNPPVRSSRVSQKASPQPYSSQHDQASAKIGAMQRGVATRRQVKNKFEKERRPAAGKQDLPLDPEKAGFVGYTESNPSMPNVPNHLRDEVKDSTKKKVLEQLGCHESPGYWKTFEDIAVGVLEQIQKGSAASLPPGPCKQMSTVRLFVAEDSHAPAATEEPAAGFRVHRQDTYLLGKFDVAAVPCKADYDTAFHSVMEDDINPACALDGNASSDCDNTQGFDGWFWVFHSAAPNIGESAQADDFVAYSVMEGQDDVPMKLSSVGSLPSRDSKACWKDRPLRPTRRLNEVMYVRDMARLWRRALQVMGYSGLDHGIFFPFGMGAFLRHLHLNDDRFENRDELRRVKRLVADEFVKAVESLCVPSSKSKDEFVRGPGRVHLCLVCVNAESVENHDCFVQAVAAGLKRCPVLAEVIQLRQNVDALELAHQLSRTGSDPKPLKVGLLNGANRKLCGNHWFQNGARFAIDENLHRRSASLARASLLLNFDTEPRPRHHSQLADTVRFFGGSVVGESELSEHNPPKGMPGTPQGKSGPATTTNAAAESPVKGPVQAPPRPIPSKQQKSKSSTGCCGCFGVKKKPTAPPKKGKS